MSASGRSVVRRTGRVLTGVGALVVLCALVLGAPVALLAFAGNPLPDHLPTLAEVGTALTSRDDGQLFLRALALAGWFGWATFAFSVVVELGAQTLRRPAPKLPGMSRQQKAAAALVGSVALILAASPAAASAAAVYSGPAYAQPSTSTSAARLPGSGPLGVAGSRPIATTGSGPLGLVAPPGPSAGDKAAPVYRVARGDYLGEVAERYLDEFGDYRQLAKLNRLDDPDRIRPGQLLRLPAEATDQGARPHATGKLVGRPAAPKPPAPRPSPQPAAPERAEQAPPGGTESTGQAPTMTVGAARAGTTDRVNRPLAVSAVLAVASIVGAQIGAVLGLRRRPATAGAAPRLTTTTRAPRGGVGRSSGSARTGRRSSGAAWAASRAAAATASTAPPTGGPNLRGVPASTGDEGWARDEGWTGEDGWTGGDKRGLAAGGPGWDAAPDEPSTGRHRRG
ncbi:LysM peptidoglycan-binding domain-containing protein [Micromonospora sp. NPDC049275]|uniref:LysM peptidoglycan-binding domain-containing protein n=1 Tax=Micromonospora sp. NPDC049275 TaxID=3364268 RepID=UPI00371092E2